MSKRISIQEVKAILGSRQEFSLVDVREQEEFSRNHQFLACCIPYGVLELRTPELIPRKGTTILLVDSGQGRFNRAERAAKILEGLGYSDVRIMEGGLAAWEAGGYETFSGVNVLSKAFGEVVEITCETPHLTPEELAEMRAKGEEVVVLDARPAWEYHNMCIPGGINAPGAELVYRVHDLAPDPDTRIVVNCAGRTRSIIGTQSLRNAGIPNPVAALKGGTMGWRLAGMELEYGQVRYSARPGPEAVKVARERAKAVAGKFSVKFVDRATMEKWMAESEETTLYIFDVRLPEEYARGHFPGARNAQGGQLVQATDEYAAVRNARYVLMDTDEVQAVMTASWLNQMGYPEVYVLAGGLREQDADTEVPGFINPGLPAGETLTAEALKELLGSDQPVAVIDVGCSKAYAAGHVPGSHWVVRSRLALANDLAAEASRIVLTADKAPVAQFALADARALWPDKPVRVLSGGTPTWTNAGFRAESGLESALCEADDVWYKPYEDTSANSDAMHGYLTWEVALVDKLERDGDAHFNIGR